MYEFESKVFGKRYIFIYILFIYILYILYLYIQSNHYAHPLSVHATAIKSVTTVGRHVMVQTIVEITAMRWETVMVALDNCNNCR